MWVRRASALSTVARDAAQSVARICWLPFASSCRAHCCPRSCAPAAQSSWVAASPHTGAPLPHLPPHHSTRLAGRQPPQQLVRHPPRPLPAPPAAQETGLQAGHPSRLAAKQPGCVGNDRLVPGGSLSPHGSILAPALLIVKGASPRGAWSAPETTFRELACVPGCLQGRRAHECVRQRFVDCIRLREPPSCQRPACHPTGGRHRDFRRQL